MVRLIDSELGDGLDQRETSLIGQQVLVCKL